MTDVVSQTQFCNSLFDLADRFDDFIVDLWGVVHDGQHPYPGVLETLTRLKAQGKRVLFLSNAPRPADRAHVRSIVRAEVCRQPRVETRRVVVPQVFEVVPNGRYDRLLRDHFDHRV